MDFGVSNAAMGADQHTGRAQEASDAEKLENFKKEIWNEINSMPWGANASIQITDDAFRKMMEDSEFKNKIMKIIREDAIYQMTLNDFKTK